ncbi:PAS domain-containing protein [Pedobacter sp. MC2016-14]|uniref:PAS domain-containing protein n=1 Tax=Pedobacter sp. MC2016-14 TaxID=2897327 RepID=UPI001E2C44BB|nr:PAS domain-containing protein [Pedobacter sp. MC2016-14]MCD0490113.1 PAS domain-containing protein [Pedobacter sp. MC2016-14]
MTLDEINAIYNAMPAPSLVLKNNTPHFTVLSANRAMLKLTGRAIDQWLGKEISEVLPYYSNPSMVDGHTLNNALNEVVAKKNPQQVTGMPRNWRIESYPILNDNEEILYIIQSLIDLTAANDYTVPLEHLEKEVLELNSVSKASITEVLKTYIKGIESIFPEMLCSIMKVKNGRIYNWLSPSLPDAYNLALNGLEIGNLVGSCGAAAFLKQKVISSDVANDERWKDFKDIALRHNLKSCWSYPIFNSDNEVVATFGMYYAEVKTPDEGELTIIERAAALVTVIMENRQYAELLEETSILMNQGQELAHFGNWSWDIPSNTVTWSDTLYSIYGLKKTEFKATFEGYLELLHVNDRERVVHTIHSILETGRDAEFEERILRPNGEIRHLKSWGTLKYDLSGNPFKMVGACLDITESKKIQEDLLRSEKNYHDLFHHSPQPMWVYELPSLKFLAVNDSAIADYGYSRDEFLQMTLRDIRPPEDVASLHEIVENEIEDGVLHSCLARHVKKSGEIIFVNARGNSLQYNGKNARIVVALDQTEKIIAEENLTESERRFKTLIQDGADLIAIMDIDTIYKYVSPNSERILSEKAEHLVGKAALSFIHRLDREMVEQAFTHLSIHKRVEIPPYRYFNGNKKLRWAETVLTDMRNDPAIAGIITNSRDITLRMEHELKIKNHLERYNIVSKATSDAIWDLDMPTGKVVWNQGIKGIFGHAKTLQSYEWWMANVHPDDITPITEKIQQHIKSKESRWTSEYRFRCANGSYKFVQDRVFLIFDDYGQPLRMIGAMQDITDRINYIHTIEQHNRHLREINWAQSHLVRAPLARILGILELLNHPNTDADTNATLLAYLTLSAKELDAEISESIVRTKA